MDPAIIERHWKEREAVSHFQCPAGLERNSFDAAVGLVGMEMSVLIHFWARRCNIYCEDYFSRKKDKMACSAVSPRG
eukprot:scaffold232819_cov14-Tisochrysis_lutea.AAC.1